MKFGAKVTLVDEDSEDEASYEIVGEFEADVKKGKISISSPIARAIIGEKKGRQRRGQHPRRRQVLRNPESEVGLNIPSC